MTIATVLSLPLTSAWAFFANVQVIPHRYGAVTGPLLQYDAAGRLWCWAGHAVAGIDRITRDGQLVGEWQWRNTTDSAGQPIALVEFGQPQEATAVFLASGRGKRHARTGALLDNPADVVWDILANLAGVAVGEGALGDFRAECHARGLVVAGSIDTAESTQTIVRTLCDSVGALFCIDAPRPCRLWPVDSLRPPRERIRGPLHTLGASLSLGDIVNDVTVQFDYVNGQARQTLQLVVADSIARFGRRAQTLPAPWIAVPRVAYDVGVRQLARTARPQWIVTVDGIRRPIDVGDDLLIDHPVLPIEARGIVVQRDWVLDAGTVSAQLAIAVGDSPVIKLARQSNAFPARTVAVSAEESGGDRVLVLRRAEDGRAIVGARVTVDNTTTRTSDNAGRVTFPASLLPPGEHTLAIVSEDGRTLTMTITIDAGAGYRQTVALPRVATEASGGDAPPEADWTDVTNTGAFVSRDYTWNTARHRWSLDYSDMGAPEVLRGFSTGAPPFAVKQLRITIDNRDRNAVALYRDAASAAAELDRDGISYPPDGPVDADGHQVWTLTAEQTHVVMAGHWVPAYAHDGYYYSYSDVVKIEVR